MRTGGLSCLSVSLDLHGELALLTVAPTVTPRKGFPHEFRRVYEAETNCGIVAGR
jgi:hypothetical protein